MAKLLKHRMTCQAKATMQYRLRTINGLVMERDIMAGRRYISTETTTAWTWIGKVREEH